MFGCLRARPLRPVVLALYALAMVTLGFAHKMPVTGFADDVRLELAALTLPDGSVPDLCLTGDASGQDTAHAGVCDACLLTAAPGLGAVASMDLPLPADLRLVDVSVPVDALWSRPAPAPQSRGPPPSPIHV